MMYEVYRPEEEKDDLGRTRKYPMGQIYASFLSFLSKNMFSPDEFLQVVKKEDYGSITTFRGTLGEFDEEDMDTYYPNGYPTFPALEKMAQVYPWVSQIIDKLTNDYLNPDEYVCFRFPPTGGSMASQFYTNFRKAYIPYAKIQLGDNKFGITPLNYEMEEKMQLDKLIANFNNRMILTKFSIYNPDGKVNRKNAATLKSWASTLAGDISKYEYHTYPEEIERLKKEDDDYAKELEKAFDKFVEDVQTVMGSFGVDANKEGVIAYLMMEEGSVLSSMLSDLSTIAEKVAKVEDKKVDTFNYLMDVQNNFGKNLVEHLFDGRGLISDMSYMQSYYDSASKKTKYSYSADNYMMKMFRGIALGSLEERRQFINDHYGRYEWFRDQSQPEGKGWRNAWLEFWYNYDKDSNILPYRNIDNVSQYYEKDVVTGQKKDTEVRQYTKWERGDIWEVQDRSYDKDNQGKGKDVGYYLAPIFSDSPMSMTLRGPKMGLDGLVYGYTDDSGVRHQGAFVQLVQQELWRIGYTQRRVQAIADGRVKAINNFDDGVGSLFCFIPELNEYTFEDGKTFLEKMTEMKADGTTISSEIEALQIKAITDILDDRMREYILTNGEKYDMEHLKGAVLQHGLCQCSHHTADHS